MATCKAISFQHVASPSEPTSLSEDKDASHPVCHQRQTSSLFHLRICFFFTNVSSLLTPHSSANAFMNTNQKSSVGTLHIAINCIRQQPKSHYNPFFVVDCIDRRAATFYVVIIVDSHRQTTPALQVIPLLYLPHEFHHLIVHVPRSDVRELPVFAVFGHILRTHEDFLPERFQSPRALRYRLIVERLVDGVAGGPIAGPGRAANEVGRFKQEDLGVDLHCKVVHALEPRFLVV
mmetsp:Transcript_39837/g.84904  ORF Transcript_39837/g.84904 Transcript_39837/m.84904 type:complete len:234 (+) Transcript_39837:186-887(+)